MKNIAVFIDRDGTINVEKEYLSEPKQLELYKGAAGAIRLLNKAGVPVVVVTNQSGIGRKMFTLNTLNSIHEKLASMLRDESRAVIDGLYFCPHTPEDSCGCRKPLLGLIDEAEKDLNIDKKNSYFIGDKVCDVEMGQKAGGKSILVLTGYGKEVQSKLKVPPALIAKNLLEAVRWILEDIKK